MSDRQIHKKTKPSKGAEVTKNACVWCLPLCVCFSRVMTQEESPCRGCRPAFRFGVSTEVGVLESPLVVSHDPRIEYGHGMM